MSEITLTAEQQAAALIVAKDVGGAIERARLVLGHSKKSLAEEVGMHMTTLCRLEAGGEPNLKIGNVIKVLDHFGLTLVVVPRDTGARDQRIGALIDRVLALKGGDDLLRHHLKRRGYELARGELS